MNLSSVAESAQDLYPEFTKIGGDIGLRRSHEQMSADIVDLILGSLEEDRGRDYVESVLPESQVELRAAARVPSVRRPGLRVQLRC